MSKQQEYITITLAGRVNVGKSSILNLLSGQKDFAIVDAHPGTTTDTVMARMEIHDLGAVKIIDTAGVDENSPLGDKKRNKTFEAIEEADLTLLVIDLIKSQTSDYVLEKDIIRRALKYKKQVLIIYNIFHNDLPSNKLIEIKNKTSQKLDQDSPSLCIDAINPTDQKKLIAFILTHFKKENSPLDLIPINEGKGFVLLNIPMDEETPTLRLLRPQDMVMERLLRKYLVPVLYRMDLKKAREGDKTEKKRFLIMIEHLCNSPEGLKLVVTDSQAMDILDPWLSRKIPITTFSVIMANYMSGGNIEMFMKGLEAFLLLKNGDRILIMESCNHDRKCNDIGTQQIPRLIKEKLHLELKIDFSFGRVLPDNLKQYKLVIHCGGCMVDRQKYMRRIFKLREARVPITNYGLFLSWVNNPQAATRVTEIFKHKP